MLSADNESPKGLCSTAALDVPHALSSWHKIRSASNPIVMPCLLSVSMHATHCYSWLLTVLHILILQPNRIWSDSILVVTQTLVIVYIYTLPTVGDIHMCPSQRRRYQCAGKTFCHVLHLSQQSAQNLKPRGLVAEAGMHYADPPAKEDERGQLPCMLLQSFLAASPTSSRCKGAPSLAKAVTSQLLAFCRGSDVSTGILPVEPKRASARHFAQQRIWQYHHLHR